MRQVCFRVVVLHFHFNVTGVLNSSICVGYLHFPVRNMRRSYSLLRSNWCVNICNSCSVVLGLVIFWLIIFRFVFIVRVKRCFVVVILILVFFLFIVVVGIFVVAKILVFIFVFVFVRFFYWFLFFGMFVFCFIRRILIFWRFNRIFCLCYFRNFGCKLFFMWGIFRNFFRLRNFLIYNLFYLRNDRFNIVSRRFFLGIFFRSLFSFFLAGKEIADFCQYPVVDRIKRTEYINYIECDNKQTCDEFP